MRSTLIKLGIIGKPVGLKGEFIVAQRDGSCPFKLDKILIGASPSTAITYQVRRQREQTNKLILSLNGHQTRDSLTPLNGLNIWLPRDELTIDEKTEYLWSDIKGKKIIDCQGVPLGEVIEISNFGASDIVVIKNSDGRLLDLPFIKDYFSMNFESTDEFLTMNLKLEDIDEFWYPC